MASTSRHPSPATTFVYADPSNFRAIVQHLTGPPPPPPPNHHLRRLPPPPPPPPKPYQPNPIFPFAFPLMLSPLDALLARLGFGTDSRVGSGSCTGWSEEMEERVIAEKGFFLHPRAYTNTNASSKGKEPQLLPLFPLHAGFAA